VSGGLAWWRTFLSAISYPSFFPCFSAVSALNSCLLQPSERFPRLRVASNLRNVYNAYNSYNMKPARSTVISMRLPEESGHRLRRLASRHGWTPSDASARLVEEGLRRSEFAFIDFRDSVVGRQACLQGSTLAVWEVVALLRSYAGKTVAVANHLRWPEAKVQAALNYAEAFPEEIEQAISENADVDFTALKRMLPQAISVPSRRKTAKSRNS